MRLFKNGSWKLKLLALILAIVTYHALKNESARSGRTDDNRSIFP